MKLNMNIEQRLHNLSEKLNKPLLEGLRELEPLIFDCIQGSTSISNKARILTILKTIDSLVDLEFGEAVFSSNPRQLKAYDVLTSVEPEVFFNKGLQKLIVLRTEMWEGLPSGKA